MPVAVIAEIGPRPRIVGAVGLHAVSHGVIADGRQRHGHRAVIVILVVVIARRVIARSAIVALRRDRAADQGAGHRAGDEAAATTVATITAGVAAAITADAAEARHGRAAAPANNSASAARGGLTEGLREACGRRQHRTTGSITAAVLKTLRLNIVGSICGTPVRPLAGR